MRPRIAHACCPQLLILLVQLPENPLPARFLALHAAHGGEDLMILAIHRPEHEARFVEHTLRQAPHPVLLGRHRGILLVVADPRRIVALRQLPDPTALVHLGRAFDLPVLVAPLPRRQPVVGREGRVSWPAVAVAERRLLLATLLL